MKFRRAEDRRVRLLIGSARPRAGSAEESTGSDIVEWLSYQWRPGDPPEARTIRHPGNTDGQVVLLDLDLEEPILIAGAAVRRLPRGRSRQDLLRRAASGAAGWERERSRIWRWLKLPDQLQGFAERLNRADTPQEVCSVLSAAIVEIVGAYDVVALLREGGQTRSLYALDARLSAAGGYHVSLPSHPRIWRPGVVTVEEAQPDVGSPFADLAHLFAGTGAASVAHLPMGDSGVLLVLERRRDRNFEPEEWTLLHSLASQAEGALRRVRSLEEVRTLSLTDPLTGVANRRRLDLMMEPAWAAALRGRPLALALVDLDDFKKINDEHGHLAGDRLLQLVAGVLQEEARGTDLVVRFGGDEFLVLLPGESAKGAAAFIGRVQKRLAGKAEFSAGTAEYREGVRAPAELIAEADQNLYQVKRRLRWQPE